MFTFVTDFLLLKFLFGVIYTMNFEPLNCCTFFFSHQYICHPAEEKSASPFAQEQVLKGSELAVVLKVIKEQVIMTSEPSSLFSLHLVMQWIGEKAEG